MNTIVRQVVRELDNKHFIWAVGLSIVGCAMLIIALFLPPLGEIAPSVLSGAGIVFAFSGAVVGIDGAVNTKLEKYKSLMEKELEERKTNNETDIL